MGRSMLQCTRPWPGFWSIFFVWGVEKPKIQGPADIARTKVGRWKLCSFGWDMMLGWVWCAAGGGQWGNYQRIWELYGQDFWSAAGGEGLVSLKSYMVAHNSKEGTSHIVRGYRGHSPTTFPWGFPKKRLSQMAFSSQQGQQSQAGRKAKLD